MTQATFKGLMICVALLAPFCDPCGADEPPMDPPVGATIPTSKERMEEILAMMRNLPPNKSPEQNVAAIRKALDSESGMEFVDASLEEVLRSLHKKHGIAIQLDMKSLEEARIDTSWPAITIKQPKISLRAGLRLMLEPLKLNCVIKDEVLLVTTTKRALAEMYPKPYPVGDLLEGKDRVTPSDLSKTIRSTTVPATWAPEGLGQVKPFGKTLVILQTDDAHEEIAKLLASLRAHAAK